MQDAFLDQDLALSAKAAAVLFLGRWRLNHRANPRFAEFVSQ